MVEQDMQASLLCAGVDSNGKGQLYAILPSGALFQHDVYAVSGSGSTYITGYLDDQLANEDTLLNEQEAINLVAKAIQLAMDRDGNSGGFVRIYSVTSNGRRSITIYPLQQETSENVKSVGSKNAPSSRDLPGFAPSVSGA
jgi:20S proteasome subunit beta 1